MHGSPWDYDTRIPILFYGAPFVRQGQSARAGVAAGHRAHAGRDHRRAARGRPIPATCCAQALAPGAGRPRVIALIVLDAMRADYFDTYADVMPTLSRMRREGAWFSEARATVAAHRHRRRPRHYRHRHRSAVPRHHRQHLFNRVTGKSQPAYDALDPRELMALTLADIWNLATDGRP